MNKNIHKSLYHLISLRTLSSDDILFHYPFHLLQLEREFLLRFFLEDISLWFDFLFLCLKDSAAFSYSFLPI